MRKNASRTPNFKVFGFLFLLLLYMVGDAEAACVRNFPSVHFTPTAGIMAASSTKGYTVTITNNDKEDTPGECGSSTFTLSVVPETNPGSFSFPSTLGSGSTGGLNPGVRYNTTLTVKTAGTITEGHKLTTIVQAVDNTNHSGKTGKGSVVTKASVYKGEGNILRRAEEEMCHSCHKTDRNRTPSDADWDQAIKTHNSTVLGSSKWSAQGGWGVAGGKYGEFVCTTCHTAHDTVNIYIIKETITTPDGSNFEGRASGSISVDFRYKEAYDPGNPKDGTMGRDNEARVSSSRVCEVCHTYDNTGANGAKYHAYSMPAVSHMGTQVCTQCHPHNGAFKGAGCNACHGYPPTVNSTTPPNGLAWSNATGSQTVGKHSLHATTTDRNYPCATCHKNTDGSGTTHNDSFITIGFYMFGGTYQGGAYDGQTSADGYDVPSPNTTPPTAVTKLNSLECSNIYCHGRPYISGAWEDLGGGSDTSPAWNGTAACGTCHGKDATTPPTRGNHSKHTRSASGGRQLPCSDCHYNYTPSAIPSGIATHVDNAANFAFNSTKTYIGSASYAPYTTTMFDAYGQCSNLYCHSNVQNDGATSGPTSYGTPTWGGTPPNCAGNCHPIYTGTGTHYNGSLHPGHASNLPQTCGMCHNNAGNETVKHADFNIDVSFNLPFSYTAGSYNGSNASPGNHEPGQGYGTCSNLYCHSIVQKADGTALTGAAGEYKTPTWGGSALGCTDCHGNPSNSGAHIEHTATYSFNCAQCHSGYAPPTSTTFHARGAIYVVIDANWGGSYAGTTTPGDGFASCFNVYCHGNYSGSGLNAIPTWGNAASGACGTCHGASNNPDGAPMSGSHEKHADTDATIKSVGQTIFNRGYSCILCHQGIVGGTGPAAYTITDTSKHVNSLVDWRFDTSDTRVSASSTYSIASGTKVPSDGTTPRAYGTCSNVYCHSIVQTSTGGALTPNTSDYTTVTWGALSSTVICGNCHKQDGSHGIGAVMDSGSHTKHLSYKFTAVSSYMKCELCHSYGVPNIAVDDCSSCHPTGEKTKHVNGVVNVNFYTSFVGASGAYNGTPAPGDGFNNCANTYCHSDGTSVSTGSIPANTSANWGTSGPLVCSSCHGNPPNYTSGSPKTNSHSAHSYGCNKCHVNTTSDGTTITNKTNHVNKTYNVDAGAGATFTYAFNVAGGTCSSISCHFNGTATWGGSTLACGACHGFPPATNAHAAHIQDATLLTKEYGNTEVKSTGQPSNKYAFGCGNCHPITSAKHADGNKDINLDPADGGPLKSKNDSLAGRTGTGGSTVCNKIYCHSDGSGDATRLAAAASPAWSTTLTGNKCGACHGNPPQYASAGAGVPGANSHYNATGFMGKEGGHMLTIHRDNIYDKVAGNGLITLDDAVSTDSRHGNPAVATTMACYVCHSGVVSSTTIDTYAMDGTTSSFRCGDCHTGAELQAGTINDKTKHVNGSANVVFATITVNSKAQLRTSSLPAGWTRNGTYDASGSYDSSTALLNTGTWEAGKTCTVVCHNNQPVQWGDTNVTCNSCHKDLP